MNETSKIVIQIIQPGHGDKCAQLLGEDKPTSTFRLVMFVF